MKKTSEHYKRVVGAKIVLIKTELQQVLELLEKNQFMRAKRLLYSMGREAFHAVADAAEARERELRAIRRKRAI